MIMDTRHQKIIDAIIQKANRECPKSLALIGVYGSVLTGDIHPKSDLDLMILINDDKGKCLADTFILEDQQIGYDLYCTTWQMLEGDAECAHPYLSKLLDCSLVYVSDEKSLKRLEGLRSIAQGNLGSCIRYSKVKSALALAKTAYADCLLADSLSDVRIYAGEVIYQLLNCIMLYHGRYFRMGVKRTFEEIDQLDLNYDIKNPAAH